MTRIVRLAGVSYAPPARDHSKGVDLSALRKVVREVMRDKPDFICFPEICACSGPVAKAKAFAPEIGPFAEAVGRIAKEAGVNLVVPLLERYAGQVYNSVPVVDRTGKLVMVYRKNYPTPGELTAGVAPGWEVPVAECDGLRVGAAVCFDVNFPRVAAELERQRARLVFWPSMFWGGALLQHWALRYGFAIVVAYGAESAIIDMDGRYLARQGADTPQVRGKRLPPWAVAEVNLDRELFHLDDNQRQFPAILAKYGPAVGIEVHQPEAFFLLSSRKEGTSVEQIAREFSLKTLRDYLAGAEKEREEHLRAHPTKGR